MSGSKPYSSNFKGCRAGINLTSDGFILTNAHNVDNSDRVLVTFKNQDKFTGQVLDKDTKFDLALIKLDKVENLPTVTWAMSKNWDKYNSDLVLADSKTVYAIGFPGNKMWQMNQGNIKQLRTSKQYRFPTKSIFKTSKNFVYPGFSGSPLINSYGQVIGITFAKDIKTGEGLHISMTGVKEFLDRVIVINRIKEGRL